MYFFLSNSALAADSGLPGYHRHTVLSFGITAEQSWQHTCRCHGTIDDVIHSGMSVMLPLTTSTASCKPIPAHSIQLLSIMLALMGAIQWGAQVESNNNPEGIIFKP